ncbi:MAG: alpha/beta fold hydrolase [Deltaproteobacteria bacterium]|nr:alpha/beta fold hydrolase [Deltaproteobacteria bacterium]
MPDQAQGPGEGPAQGQVHDEDERQGRGAAKTAQPKSDWVDASVSILNAVVGDYLAQTHNDLAIEMGFYQRGEPLGLERESLASAFSNATNRICVFIHGMACNETCWSFPGEPSTSYGTLLERDLNYTPLFLRYNTGLHISTNGKALAALLERILEVYSPPVEELVLVGHSMGGLVLRSACHYGESFGHRWPTVMRTAFYLGAPHLGAPLEKIGGALSIAMHAVNEPVVRLVRKVANLRSSGVKDLRHANLVDEDWAGRDPDTSLRNWRTPVPLKADTQHYVIAGTLAKDAKHLISQLFGDAMVRLGSATGQPEREDRAPRFPKENLRVLTGINHMNLAHSPDVYREIREGCGQAVRTT